MADLAKLLVETLKQQLATGARKVAVPAGGALVWRWFTDLHNARTYHAHGPNPISYQEIQAYAAATRWLLEPRHVEIIRAMDRAYLDHSYLARQRDAPGVKTLPPISSQVMNVGMFDAIFG
ncbi:phage tail assembly chaperone [Rhizobium sp. HT1-10]|uniref:phage tail assembly chaperone n=1 Tax=Rhizobium sp. HT1-10 TaxID=3111638 RepID=UPI003C1D587A